MIPSASAPGLLRSGGKGVTIAMIAKQFKLDHPVQDQTGLNGTFDFSLEWSPAPDAARPGSISEETGPTFLEALNDQLGLKLESTKGPVDVLVIDHIEEPSPN